MMQGPAPIPFVDLVSPHMELREELEAVFSTALRTGSFIGGPTVEAFEREFAQQCAASHCIGVANGTDALRLALIAAGVVSGDVVVTVPNSFIATVESISQAGARPEFVDIDERTYNMSPVKLREYLELSCYTDPTTGRLLSKRSQRRVSAIVPVHLYGQVADMDSISTIADKYNLAVVEDACQAHGAQYFSNKEKRWRKAGAMGRAAAFSFYPGKNLGACGEAGAVTTNDETLAKQIRMLRDHGQSRQYYHDIEGFNSRLDAIQAGILSVKLKRLSEWNDRRRENALRYRNLLTPASDKIVIPFEPSWSKAIYHLYVIRTSDRDQLQSCLDAAYIGTKIHYPVNIHHQKACRNLGYGKGAFPVAEKAASEILSLPMHPYLRFEQQVRVADTILEFIASRPTGKPRAQTLLASA
jgi:dTDP-4-amino-4,6-dideoxygalactose transaminase